MTSCDSGNWFVWVALPGPEAGAWSKVIWLRDGINGDVLVTWGELKISQGCWKIEVITLNVSWQKLSEEVAIDDREVVKLHSSRILLGENSTLCLG